MSSNTLKYLVLIFISFTSIFPLYYVFTIALSGWDGSGWPFSPRWENFLDAWNFMQSPTLWRAFLNSTVVSVSRTLLVLFASSLTAYALAVYKFWGNRAIFLWILSRLMLPTFVTLIPSYMLMVSFGWVNTYWSLIIPAFVNAYSIFLIRQYILTIPEEVIDAARMYGCGEFGIFWRIILPLAKPVLAVVAILNFMWTWNDFLWPSLVLENRDMFTVQLALSWVSPSGPLGAALVVLSILPLIIVTVVAQKYLLKGFAGLGYVKR